MTDTLDEIRERHEAFEGLHAWSDNEARRAHADRATLLRLLDAAREELKALKRSQALDELVAISQEAGLYDDPPPTRAQGESS
jgi:hypothetical protein